MACVTVLLSLSLENLKKVPTPQIRLWKLVAAKAVDQNGGNHVAPMF